MQRVLLCIRQVSEGLVALFKLSLFWGARLFYSMLECTEFWLCPEGAVAGLMHGRRCVCDASPARKFCKYQKQDAISFKWDNLSWAKSCCIVHPPAECAVQFK